MSNLDNLIRYIHEGELLSKEYEARMSVLMSGINSNLDQNLRKGKKKIMQQNLTQQSIRDKAKSFVNEKSATFLTEEILNLSLERANSKIFCQSDRELFEKKPTKAKSKQKQQQTNKKPSEIQKKTKKNSTICVSAKIEAKSATTTPSSNSSFKNEVKKSDIRSRYWAYLFDNLKRAVDEIYQTCENDDSVSECKEVILILESCVNDFQSLISRIQTIREYEKLKSNHKPVAWEVRKSSPRKSTNLVNNSSSQFSSEVNESYREQIKNKSNKSTDQSMIGFRDFNPNQNFLNKNFTNEYNDEDSYFDEYDLDNNQKFNSDPIDLLNHETFSDLQSINTDDVSLNTTSPFMAQNFPNIPPSSINQLSVQTHYFNNLLNQQHWMTDLNPLHLSLMQCHSLNKNQFTSYSNIISNPSELSPFNNYLAEPARVINSAVLNESFENVSLYDDSFRNYTVKDLKQNDMDDEQGDDEYDGAEDADEEDMDDVLGYEFMKKTKLSKRNANHRHDNMLKFYEEEEKTIVMEIKQDEKLLSFLNEEAKLTKQLSVDQLMHYQYDIIKKNVNKDNMVNDYENDDMVNSKFSTDLENNDTERNTPLIDFWKKVNQHDEGEYEMELNCNQGRTIHVHEKLLSMPRKESPNERRRKHEEKQARAQEKREQFYQERLNKLRELTKKIEKVSELKKKLLRTKKATLLAKLQRAEEKRQYLLNLKATKAATEEQKAHEIAFINNLAAQNRKLSILEKHERRNEVIRHNIEEERLRKQEEQKAKEQAAELRRKKLENQRVAKINEIMEKRKQKQSKIEQTQLEKEKERIETARAKVKSREMKLARKEAQFQANKQQVKKRLMQKQEEWGKRHELNLEEIRKKAFEMSIMHFSGEDNSGEAPTPHPYDKPKYCKVCNVTINSEVQLKSHLRGLKHQQVMNESNQGKNLTQSEIEEYNINCIIDAPNENSHKESLANEERKRQLKKRLKKLKTKLLSKGSEYENTNHDNLTPSETSSLKALKNSKIPKLVKEMEKNSGNIQILSKHSSEIIRIIQKNSLESILFRHVNGPSIIIKILEQVSLLSAQQPAAEVNLKCANSLISILVNVTKNCLNSTIDFIMSNRLMSLVEILNDHSNIMLLDITGFDFGSSSSNKNKISNNWLICSSLFDLIGSIFSCLNSKMETTPSQLFDSNPISSDDCKKIDQFVFLQRATDLAALVISYGLVDTLSVFFSNIRGPLDNDLQMAEILKSCLEFLVEITKFSNKRKFIETFSDKKSEDNTGIISTFKSTNLVNIVSMLYGILHKDASTPVKLNQTNNQSMKKLSSNTFGLCLLSLKLLNQIIVLDLTLFQNVLGEDSLSLQIRHISSYLIWYFKTYNSEDLLHEVILLIGYFTVLNSENQRKIVLGTPPTILQQLCNLSFNYFSDKRLILILFPTLISCCFNNEKNKSVLTNELSADMLVNFIQQEFDKIEKTVEKQDKYEFDKRFPLKLWQEAINYFSM